MNQAVKFIKDTPTGFVVGGYGVVWDGRDLSGEFFTKATDFWFDRLTETPPVLYQHGMDPGIGKTVLGKVTTKTIDDVGMWIEAEIATAKNYADAIKPLVARGVVGWSSGAPAHLVEKERGGKIKSWPVAEWSLTPTPCEPRTLGVTALRSFAEDMPALKSFLDLKGIIENDPGAVLDVDPLNPDEFFQSHPHPAEISHAHQHADGTSHSHAHGHLDLSRSHDTNGHSHDVRRHIDQEPDADTVPESTEESMKAIAALIGPVALEIDAIDQRLTAFALSTKGLLERRTREGREFSTRNEAALLAHADRLAGHVTDCAAMAESFRGLVDSSRLARESRTKAEQRVDPAALQAQLDLLDIFMALTAA